MIIFFPSEVLSSELHCRICYSRRHFKMAAMAAGERAISRELSALAQLACAGKLIGGRPQTIHAVMQRLIPLNRINCRKIPFWTQMTRQQIALSIGGKWHKNDVIESRQTTSGDIYGKMSTLAPTLCWYTAKMNYWSFRGSISMRFK